MASAGGQSSVGRKDVPWCLWCLSRPEIGAIYAEQLKGLQNTKTVEIANVHAVFTYRAEDMMGCLQKLGEYPTLSAILFNGLGSFLKLFPKKSSNRPQKSAPPSITRREEPSTMAISKYTL
jgi:hypothetical protein